MKLFTREKYGLVLHFSTASFKIEYKDLMSLKIFKEKRKRRAGKKKERRKRWRREGREKGRKRNKQTRN